jgi:hypothetical protein
MGEIPSLPLPAHIMMGVKAFTFLFTPGMHVGLHAGHLLGHIHPVKVFLD